MRGPLTIVPGSAVEEIVRRLTPGRGDGEKAVPYSLAGSSPPSALRFPRPFSLLRTCESTAMPPIPTTKELRRILRGMDVADRARLKTMARAGKLAENPQEAALVAATAREELRLVRWVPIVAGVIISLEAVRAALTDDPAMRLTSLSLIVVVAVLAIPKLLRRRSSGSLIRAERLNRELAGGHGPASEMARSPEEPH